MRSLAPEQPRRGLTGAIVPAMALAALAGLGSMYAVSRQDEAVLTANGAPPGCIINNADAMGGPIDLVDVNGAPVTQAAFTGQPSVVYFGYTHCPDVCPMSLLTLGQALSASDSYDVQPVFISVDPARDTPDALKQYAATNGFPAGLVALTGSRAQITAAARAFQASYSADPATATVNHTTFLYVLDANWRTVAAMATILPGERQADGSMGAPTPAPPADVGACIAAGLERGA